MGRRDADTHLLKNLRGEHALMNIEVKGTALEHELGAIKHRQREVEMEAQGIATPSKPTRIQAKIKAIGSMSTGNVRHEVGKTPAGQELLLLFGAKRSPQDELQRAKAHEIKELEQDKSEPQSQVSNLEHDLESNLIAKGKLEQDKSVLQLEVLSLKDNLDSIQEGKEGLEQKKSQLQSTVSNLRLGGIILGEKSVDSGNGDIVGWAIHPTRNG